MTEKITVRLVEDFPQVVGSINGCIPEGFYVVQEREDGDYRIAEGLFSGCILNKEKCLKETTTQYVLKPDYTKDLEVKLSKAGLELVDLMSENDQIKRQVKEANRVLEGVTTLLGYIQQESVGFEVDPTTPLGSLETIRRVLIRKATEIKELKAGDPNKKIINDIKSELDMIDKMDGVYFVVNKEHPVTALQNIRYNLGTILKDQSQPTPSEGAIHRIVDDMLSRYGIKCDQSLHEKVTLLSENVNGNRETKVPSDVAKSLDKHIQDKELPFEIFYAYAEEMSKSNPHRHKIKPDKIVSDYVFMKGLIHFFDIMQNGYVAEKTEREIRNEKLEEVFQAYGRDECTLDNALKLIERLYEEEQA